MTDWANLPTPSGRKIKRVFQGDNWKGRVLIEVDFSEWYVFYPNLEEFSFSEKWTKGQIIELGWSRFMDKDPIWSIENNLRPRFKRLIINE